MTDEDWENEEVRTSLMMGGVFPYDAGEAFWDTDQGTMPPTPPAKDWAHYAARGVLANLLDRRGIKGALHDVNHDVRAEITQMLAAIIRQAPEKFQQARGRAA